MFDTHFTKERPLNINTIVSANSIVVFPQFLSVASSMSSKYSPQSYAQYMTKREIHWLSRGEKSSNSKTTLKSFFLVN